MGQLPRRLPDREFGEHWSYLPQLVWHHEQSKNRSPINALRPQKSNGDVGPDADVRTAKNVRKRTPDEACGLANRPKITTTTSQKMKQGERLKHAQDLSVNGTIPRLHLDLHSTNDRRQPLPKRSQWSSHSTII